MCQAEGLLWQPLLPDAHSRAPDGSLPLPMRCLQDWSMSGTSGRSSGFSLRGRRHDERNRVLRRMSPLWCRLLVRRKCQQSRAGSLCFAHRQGAAHRWPMPSSSVLRPPRGYSATMLPPTSGTRYNWCANPQTLPPDEWFSAITSHLSECCRWPEQPPLPPDKLLPSVVNLNPASADDKLSAERQR